MWAIQHRMDAQLIAESEGSPFSDGPKAEEYAWSSILLREISPLLGVNENLRPYPPGGGLTVNQPLGRYVRGQGVGRLRFRQCSSEQPSL